MKLIDLVGDTYGRLTVISRAANIYGKPAWNCSCSCGTHKIISGKSMRSGNTLSCGCIKTELLKTDHRSRTHGQSHSVEHRAWGNMKSRCYNPNHENYPYYGARGIIVCDRWKNSFENFLSDMGYRPSAKLSLDRKDNDGNYEPSNCRWATAQQQNLNKRYH